jgi:hypothetical protein
MSIFRWLLGKLRGERRRDQMMANPVYPLPVVLSTSAGLLDVPLAVSQPGLSGGILQSVTTVGVTAIPIPASPLAGRATMLVQASPTNTANIYLGASTVTADTAATGGIMLLPGQSIPISLAAAVILYAISTVAGQLVRTFEVAA